MSSRAAARRPSEEDRKSSREFRNVWSERPHIADRRHAEEDNRRERDRQHSSLRDSGGRLTGASTSKEQRRWPEIQFRSSPTPRARESGFRESVTQSANSYRSSPLQPRQHNSRASPRSYSPRPEKRSREEREEYEPRAKVQRREEEASQSHRSVSNRERSSEQIPWQHSPRNRQSDLQHSPNQSNASRESQPHSGSHSFPRSRLAPERDLEASPRAQPREPPRHHQALRKPEHASVVPPKAPHIEAAQSAKNIPDSRIQPLPPPPPRRQMNPALDFLSAQFDASLALATPGLAVPNPRVQPLQMLQQCRFILPPEMEESLVKLQLRQRPEEFEEVNRGRSGPVAKRRAAEELKHSAIDRIAQAVTKGPLLLLQKCYNEGGRVKIWTRHDRGVRGTATGVLKAFDKHMNLVLQEVEEQYTVRLKIQRTKAVLKRRSQVPELGPDDDLAPDAAEESDYVLVDKTRTAFKQEHRSRSLKQIFVRGSNVMLVSRL